MDKSTKKISRLNNSEESIGLEGLAYAYEGASGGFIAILGGATTAASIPFFISAGKNKRKASLSLKGETLSFGKLNSRKSQLLSVAVTIDL